MFVFVGFFLKIGYFFSISRLAHRIMLAKWSSPLGTMSESPRPHPLTSITWLAPKMCISLQRWPDKTYLQDFPASELRGKMSTANVIVAGVEDTMDILLGRNLSEYLIPPLAKQICIDNSIQDCLSSEPSSFPSVQAWWWLFGLEKTPNVLERLSSLHLRFLELDIPNCHLF